MAIINRELDVTQRRTPIEFVSPGLMATGATGIVCVVPYPCSVDAVNSAAFGISGSPTVQLNVQRFIPGVGSTVFPIVVGTSNLVAAYGTSGSGLGGATAGLLIPTIGSTLTTLSANDVLLVQLGGTNSAVSGLGLSVVLRPLSDITKIFGYL